MLNWWSYAKVIGCTHDAILLKWDSESLQASPPCRAYVFGITGTNKQKATKLAMEAVVDQEGQALVGSMLT